MSALTEFFLSGLRSSVQLELLEISHPQFSQTYRKVRNARQGVTTEVGVFDYMPMKIAALGSRDDLDNGITVSFGDLGKRIPKEYDRIKREDAFNVKPAVRFWVYDSANLSTPLFGPVRYEIKALAFEREGVTFKAAAPELNYSATGLLYRLDVFFMLRGAL